MYGASAADPERRSYPVGPPSSLASNADPRVMADTLALLKAKELESLFLQYVLLHLRTPLPTSSHHNRTDSQNSLQPPAHGLHTSPSLHSISSAVSERSHISLNTSDVVHGHMLSPFVSQDDGLQNAGVEWSVAVTLPQDVMHMGVPQSPEFSDADVKHR